MRAAPPSESFEAPAGRDDGVAVALGGGAARGLAHILMIEALDELGVRPRIVAGTSMGAIVGACYAGGLSGREIREHAEGWLAKPTDFVRRIAGKWPGSVLSLWNPMTPSMFNGETLFEIVLPERLPRTFEALPIPFLAVAADFYAQEQVILDKGALIPAVAASASLPALLKPVRLGERLLIDGGFVNPTPFDLVMDKAAITVAVDVTGTNSRRPDTGMPSSVEAWIGAAQITLHSITREKLKSIAPDILIRPNVGAFGALEFFKMPEILEAAMPAKEELKRRLGEQLEKLARSPRAAHGH
ncbi:MAG: patatin-like phospholipase family protein [Hyphomicrobiaceae bacterium]|nr:patatin-like phospholipase family protein [Hyphomicrobiaceae bacterium]